MRSHTTITRLSNVPASLTCLLFLALLPQSESQPDPIRVMSFNIRYGTANDGENRWEQRRDLVIETIADRAPQILGVQEALAFQIDELSAALPQFQVLGQGRRGGREGEFAALFVNRNRFTIEAHGDFWLSPTPDEVGSQGWDAALPRMCTWAVLRDRKNGSRFRVLNTHFDHRGRKARLESASVLIAEGEVGSLPVIITGDLNADEESPPLARLREAGLRDTFRVMHPKAQGVGTFNGFRGTTDGGKIDYVLVDSPWRVEAAEIVRDNEEGRYPSDHFPVIADLVLREGER